MINELNANVLNETVNSSQFKDGKFANSASIEQVSLAKNLAITWRFFTQKRIDTEPNSAIPMKQLTLSHLHELDNQQFHVIRLGHSSFLLKMSGKFWLLDPVFSERASPFSFIGPKRFHPTPIALDALPEIEGVLISHNHYDHLDKHAIKKLKNIAKHFYVPLGVEGDLQRFGIDGERITHLDWWQSVSVGNVTLTFTPTQHFSGRGLSDGNKTLWGSWVIKTPTHNLFFSGDSGYFDGFKEIGNRFGPFDLTLIETGAYDKDWPDIHMTPEQSIQAHLDLKGNVMMPIHNGTFDLAFHTWYEPFERVTDAAKRHDVSLCTPIVGEVITLGLFQQTQAWWQTISNTTP